MAVVTHGSFDEGPIVLALPSIYEYAGTEETDPVFTAWDKSTGISITESQITDLGDYVITADLADYVTDQELVDAANVLGTNFDEHLNTNYVPYSNATNNVDLTGYWLGADRLYVGVTPAIDDYEVATKGYVDDTLSLIGAGISLQQSILSFVANYAALPGVPSEGDRHITLDDGSIWQYTEEAWVEDPPSTGWMVWDIDSEASYTWDSNAWINMVYAINHNDTLNKEGGGGGHWYHLSGASNTVVNVISDTDTADTVTGLTVDEVGISTGSDGTQSAYIRLSWDASTYTAFDHYMVAYQKYGNLGWSSQLAYTNSILIEGLVPGVYYNFKVYSVNKYGTISTESDTVQQMMETDNQAPGVTTVTGAYGGIQMVLIEWTHNTASDLAYYNVYRNTVDNTGTAVLKGNTKSSRYTDVPLPISTEYYYWVKAVDTSGNECSTFSTEVHATTKAVEAEDITSITAQQVLITGVTYLSNWTGTDSTKIDGGSIETDTITLSKLKFTPGLGYGIVGAINAYEDGIQISASNIDVVGSTIFTAKVGGSYTSSENPVVLSRVSIFPTLEPNIGLKVTDNLGASVFSVEIAGTNVGDVTIGNWAGLQGVKYDKSAGSLTVRGAIYASSGSISGIFDFGTQAVSYTGQSENMAIVGADMYENTANAHGSAIRINRIGYQGGVTRYRNTIIYDGEGNQVLTINGASRSATVYGALTLSTTTGGLVLPSMTTTQRIELPKAAGTIVYDTTQKRFCGVIMNSIGVLEWWTFGMNTNLG